MKKLLPIVVVFLSCSAFAQLGNVNMKLFTGVPSGTCTNKQLAINMTTGDLYDCLNGTWHAAGTSSGTGTLTSFSAGNLSPLFTTSVSNPTTTPALSFTLSTAAANSVFGNCTVATTTPSYCSITAAMVPTLNQNTTGSAAKWTTPRNLAGNSVDGSANVAFTNKFIVQGTSDAGLSGAQFLGALSTGLLKNTTSTGVLSTATAADVDSLYTGAGKCYLFKGTSPGSNDGCDTPGGTGISGTLTATRIPFATGTSTVTDSANLTFSAAAGITEIQGANGADMFYAKRNTDTTPSGNFLHFQDAGAANDMFKVDVAGNLTLAGTATATSYATSNAAGNAGQVSLVQGTAPSAVANAVNFLAPTSVTTYTLTLPSTVAAGLWSQNASGVVSFGNLSGDVTGSGLTTTVTKVNGVAYSASPSTTTIPEITSSNTATYRSIPDCGDSTHAEAHTAAGGWTCQAITATASAGGSNTQVQFNSGGALAGSANLTWVSPVLTVGAAGVTGQVSIPGSTSGATALQSAAVASGTLTLPAATDTLIGKATTDTLTNKTYDTAGSGNVFKVNGTTISAVTGSGSVVLATSPALTTPNLGTPSAITLTNGTGLPGSGLTNNSVTATQLAAQYSKGSCSVGWWGSGTSNAMTTGDDNGVRNGCYNDSGVTRTITAVKCRSDNAANTTTINPTFGADGTGTTILSGALTCGNSYAYAAGTLSSTSWTTGTGIAAGMATLGNAQNIDLIVEYTY